MCITRRSCLQKQEGPGFNDGNFVGSKHGSHPRLRQRSVNEEREREREREKKSDIKFITAGAFITFITSARARALVPESTRES